MFDRYNEGARRTLFFARDEAFRLRSQAIEPEHLLLGLIRSGDEPAGELLARAHVTLESLRQGGDPQRPIPVEADLLDASVGPVSTPHGVPFSRACKRALRHAAEEADRLRHDDIRPGHLLLGILWDAHSVASTMLSGQGMQLGSAREDLFGDPD